MIGDLVREDLEELIRDKKWDELRLALAELDPADIAEVLIDVPPEDEGVVFRLLPRDLAAKVFSYLPLEHQGELVQSLGNVQVQAVLSAMTPDDRTRLLEELPAETTRRVIETLPPEQLKVARTLLGYPEGTAGRYMTPQYVSLRADMTAGQALEHVRRTGQGKETLAILYIVDENNVLIDECRLGRLVLAPPDAKVTEVDDRSKVSILATLPGDEIVKEFERYDRAALPVVDFEGHMLGIITADDVLEFSQQQATEEIQKLGGSEALEQPYLQTGFMEMVKKRGGWLAVLFVGEMLTATAMGSFEDEIAKATVIALFVPLIISSGGNSGSQGTSLIIRAMALGEVTLRDFWRVAHREIRTGLTLGAFLGALGFARIALWQGLSHINGIGEIFRQKLPDGSHAATAYGEHWFLLGLTVFIALVGVVTWGSMSGSLLPFLLRKVGFDPATSSAPFVATMVDVTGLVIYFLVAKVILTGTLL